MTGVEFSDPNVADYFIFDEQKYVNEVMHSCTVSPHLSLQLNKLYGISPTVLVNSMLYSHSLSSVSGSDVSARQVLGIPNNDKIIIYSGSVTTQRRVHLPLYALSKIPNLHYVIVTNKTFRSDSYLSEIVDNAKSMKISHRLHFLPYVEPDRAWEVMIGCNATLSMLPRYPNGDVALPNKLFDSIKASVPILTSDNPQLKEFVDSRNCGLAFKADCEVDLFNKLQQLLVRDFHIDPSAFRKYTWDVQFRNLMNKIKY